MGNRWVLLKPDMTRFLFPKNITVEEVWRMNFSGTRQEAGREVTDV